MELAFHASCEDMKKQKIVNVYNFFYGLCFWELVNFGEMCIFFGMLIYVVHIFVINNI
jgi:hypothetical protein